MHCTQPGIPGLDFLDDHVPLLLRQDHTQILSTSQCHMLTAASLMDKPDEIPDLHEVRDLNCMFHADAKWTDSPCHMVQLFDLIDPVTLFNNKHGVHGSMELVWLMLTPKRCVGSR